MKGCSIRSIATRTPRNLFQQAEAHSTIEALNSLSFGSVSLVFLKSKDAEQLPISSAKCSLISKATPEESAS